MLKLDCVSKVYKTGTFGGGELTAVDEVSFSSTAARSCR